MAVTGAILVDSSVLSKETQKIRFIISMETTAQEIISKILSRFNMNSRDPNLFYITMEALNNSECASQPVKSLQNNHHPLEMQLHSGGNAKFTVQMRSGGVVKVYDNCLTSASFYKSMFISKYTTSYQLIQLLLTHYGVAEGPENFLLAVMDDNGKEGKDLSKCDCPLQLQQSSKTKISFSLKRVKKQSNLSRPHSFHGVSEQRAKEQQLNSLRRSLRKKGKNIRFDFDQTDEEREEAIEQLRSNLHQLTNNKESVFYNVQRSPLNTKITLDKDDHKEFLRAKIENLKQRKLLESRRHSDQSVLEEFEASFANDEIPPCRSHRTSRVLEDFEAPLENEAITPRRPHRMSRVEHDVNGLDKENYTGSTAYDDSYPGKREAYLSSEDSSGAVTPVLKDDFEQRLNRENGEVESRWGRGSDEILKTSDISYESETDKSLSNIHVPRNSKNENRDADSLGQGQAELDDQGISYLDDQKTPLVTPRTPFQTPRANPASNNDPNSLGVPNADPYGSPTPTASGRGSRISNTSDFQSVSFDSSGAPTPTPKMDEYSSVEKDTFAQAVKAKNTMSAIDEARELEKTLQSSDTESEPGTPSKGNTVPKLQRSRSTEKDLTPRKSIASLPSVGSTPIHTPRIDSKKSKPKVQKTESKSSEQDSESDTKSRSRSHSMRAQDPPNNTAKRKEVARGRIQNPDTPPQTPRSARSRTHSTETPIRTSSRTDNTPRSRTQSQADDTPLRTPRTQSRNDRETARSRTQSRADETPLRTPRTQSRAEESADENMTPRSRSNSSQSARSDVESQGQRSRKMPPARSNLRNKGSSLSDSESMASRKTTVKGVGGESRSEESLRKPVSRGTVQRNVLREQKGTRAPAVRKVNASGYSSDKTHEKVTPKKDVLKKETSGSDLENSSLNKTLASKKKSSGDDTDSGKGDDTDRRRSSTKEFREIVTDRLYQLSRTPSTRRKNYKPAQQVAEKKEVSSESQRSSAVSSVVNDSGSPETQTHDIPAARDDPVEAKVTKGQTTTHSSAHGHRHENTRRDERTQNTQKTTASSGYSSDTHGNSSSLSMTSEEGLKSTPKAAARLRKMSSLNSEDGSITDGSVVSDADNTSAKESMTSDLEAQEKENALQRRRRRRPRRSLPAIPNMAEVDLEERKKQLFSGAKQRLQRVYTESSYDSESSVNKSDIDSQSERGEGNASRASTLTGRDEDEKLPLYLISASCPETEDTGDDQASISSSAFESPKSDDEEIMNVISRGKQKTNFTAELVPPIKTNFSQPSGDSRSGSKVGTHTEEQIYRAKQNLLKGINVTFKSRQVPNSRGYRTDAEDECGNGRSTARGYISDQGNRGSSGYVSDQSGLVRTHVNAGSLGPLLVKSGANTVGLPKQLVPIDPDQERLIAAKYQFLQHQLSGKTGSLHAEEIIDPLSTPRVKRKLTNTQTQTDIRRPNFNRPSIQKVLQSCDLVTLTIDRGRYLSYGIRLFEGVFQPLSSRHSLRSPRGKRPLIGQNKSAFSRVRPMTNEDEIESVISVDKIGDRSAANQDGRLQEGDYVVEVNGTYVMDSSLMEVQGALETSGTKLDLVIARTKVLNLAKEDIGLAPHTDLEKELEKLKLKYNNVLEESQQKDRLIEELRSVIVKKAQIRQVKDGVKNCKINVDLLECSAV